jgi:hypothetical protein
LPRRTTPCRSDGRQYPLPRCSPCAAIQPAARCHDVRPPVVVMARIVRCLDAPNALPTARLCGVTTYYPCRNDTGSTTASMLPARYRPPVGVMIRCVTLSLERSTVPVVSTLSPCAASQPAVRCLSIACCLVMTSSTHCLDPCMTCHSPGGVMPQ